MHEVAAIVYQLPHQKWCPLWWFWDQFRWSCIPDASLSIHATCLYICIFISTCNFIGKERFF